MCILNGVEGEMWKKFMIYVRTSLTIQTILDLKRKGKIWWLKRVNLEIGLFFYDIIF